MSKKEVLFQHTDVKNSTDLLYCEKCRNSFDIFTALLSCVKPSKDIMTKHHKAFPEM